MEPDTLDAKWTPSLLSPDALSAFAALNGSGDFATLQTWGETTLGMVTGSNRYFALSPQRLVELGLTTDDVTRLSPPGSRHLRGLTFSKSAFDELGESGAATYLFRPSGEPSKAAWQYIKAGEVAGVHNAYKCRIRADWWRVPLVPPADLFLTYMNADAPRLCTNRARVHHLNSVHGVYVRPEIRNLAMDYLPLASINSMTLVGAETIGRAYGGGMLKVEPKEADQLPMPSTQLVESARGQLAELRRKVRRALRVGRLADAARLIDDLLLIGELGMRRSDVRALSEAHAELMARRLARGKEASRG